MRGGGVESSMPGRQPAFCEGSYWICMFKSCKVSKTSAYGHGSSILPKGTVSKILKGLYDVAHEYHISMDRNHYRRHSVVSLSIVTLLLRFMDHSANFNEENERKLANFHSS